ncbi:hypothetical protein TNCV_4116141 [Trichonephila clavipes]|nr:hypothetical protein TNCV_4116141 [Trichonephila clavipes]
MSDIETQCMHGDEEGKGWGEDKYTGYLGLKYPKVMDYYCGTTHQNVLNSSSMDRKTLTSLVEMWTHSKKCLAYFGSRNLNQSRVYSDVFE